MIVILFVTNSFFGSIDELEMHQLCYLITIQLSKHMLSKSCKGAPKMAPIFAT